MYFTSPTSNITPAMTSVAMSRLDSRDSNTSSSSSIICIQPQPSLSAYAALTMRTSPASWPSTSHYVTRTHSNISATSSTIQSLSPSSQSMTSASLSSHHHLSSTEMRRGSSSGWMPSPYRSAMSGFCLEEPSAYLSDDDLLYLTCASDKALPVESIPNPEQPKRELTTEEQIAMLREMQERGDVTQLSGYGAGYVRGPIDERRKVVRFSGPEVERRPSRRASTLKRRTTAFRRGLSTLNGPQ